MSKYSDTVAMWRAWQIQTEADIDLRLENFRILFAYHSGKIENEAITYSDTRELFENGRVGRTLLHYYLMMQGHPPLIVHDDDKAAYYGALAAYDEAEDLEPMATFLKRQTERTWKQALERRQRREGRS